MKIKILLSMLTTFCLTACSGGRTITLIDPTTSASDSESLNTSLEKIEIDARKGKGIPIPSIPVEKEPTNPQPTPTTPSPVPDTATDIGELDAKLPKNAVFVPGDGANISLDAIWIGNDTSGTVRSYICRAQQGKNYLLGSLKSNGKCYVTDGTVTMTTTLFEVLIYLDWSAPDVMTTAAGDGNIHPKGLAMGIKDGRTQYLCFVMAQNDYFFGSIDSQSNGCVFADFGSGKEKAPAPNKSSPKGYMAFVRT